MKQHTPEMRVLIKSNEKHLTVYKIIGTPDSIISYCANTEHTIAHLGIPSEIDEIHFTYPADGRIHYTLKKRKKVWNRTDRRKGWKKNLKVTTPTLLFLSQTLPSANLTPTLAEFREGSRFFAFGNIAFNASESVKWKLGWKEGESINPAYDIIVDVETCSASTTSISAFLVSKNTQNINITFLLNLYSDYIKQELPYGFLYLGIIDPSKFE